MMDSAEKLAQAELRLAKAQEALDDVGQVLAAAEQAQAAADRARDAANHAHEALRKLNIIVPALAVLLGLAVLVSRKHRSRSIATTLSA